MLKPIVPILSLFLVLAGYAYSDSNDLSSITTEIGDSIIINGGTTPLWQSSKQWGTVQDVPIQHITEILHYHQLAFPSKLSLDYGIRALLSISENTKAQTNELFFRIQYDFLYFYVGKMRDVIGAADSELSCGSMVISDNAESMPKISAGFSHYVTIPYTFDIVQIKGHLAHGWFQDERYISDVLLHEKDAYVRLNTHIGILPYAGLVHEAMWGGTYPDGTKVCDMSLGNFLRLFIAGAGDEDAPIGDQDNAFGNHLGIWDFGVDISYPMITGKIYYQHFFDDDSGFSSFQNTIDGLWGVDFKIDRFPFVEEVLYEFLHTTSQSGDLPHTQGGHDNYYMHWTYLSGWTYKDRILGNSFFGTAGEGENLVVDNNRIRAHHIGLKGHHRQFHWKFLISRAGYYPTYAADSMVDEKEWMWHTLAETTLCDFLGTKGLKVGCNVAYDFGTMEDAFGGGLFLRWAF